LYPPVLFEAGVHVVVAGAGKTVSDWQSCGVRSRWVDISGVRWKTSWKKTWKNIGQHEKNMVSS
jgi:hypothetical protein